MEKDHIVVLAGAQMTTYYGPYTEREAGRVSTRFNTRAAQLGVGEFVESHVRGLSPVSDNLERTLDIHVN